MGKPRASQSTLKRGKSLPGCDLSTGETFKSLQQTVIYRKLAIEERSRLDSALLAGGMDEKKLASVLCDFNLQTQYGVTLEELNTYRHILEQFVQPFLAAATVSAVLEAMPKRLIAGIGHTSRIMAWILLVRLFNDQEIDTRALNTMARLVTVLQSSPSRHEGRSRAGKSDGVTPTMPDAPWELSFDEISKAVRSLYGINLSPDIEQAGRSDASD